MRSIGRELTIALVVGLFLAPAAAVVAVLGFWQALQSGDASSVLMAGALIAALVVVVALLAYKGMKGFASGEKRLSMSDLRPRDMLEPTYSAPSAPQTAHERDMATMGRALERARSTAPIGVPTPDERRDIEAQIDALHIDGVLSPAPLLEIAIADPPDGGAEGALEWPHIAVKNISGRRLTQVHAEVLVATRYGASGTVENLRWDPGDAEYVALEPDFPNNTRTLPLVLRSREQDYSFNTALRHLKVVLSQWECYVTGERFLLNGDQGLRIAPGDMDLRVTVTFDQDGEAHAWFRAYVPRVMGKPLWIVPLPAARDAQG